MERLVICRAAAALLAMLALSGCNQLTDSERVRLCRSLIPLFDAASIGVVIGSTHVARKPGEPEQTIQIEYTSNAAIGTEPPRQITCIFDDERHDPAPDPRTGAAADFGVTASLSAVVATDGAIGPLRLYLAKHNWIARGAAAAADPAPSSMSPNVPQLPRELAIGLQDTLAALPQIAIYTVLAAAYALIYGLTGRINLAFGELTVLAGYGAVLGATAATTWGTAIALAIALALGIATGVMHGAAFGTRVLLPLVDASNQAVLIATVGMALVWSELVRLAQGPEFRWMPPVLNKTLAIARSDGFVVTTTPMAMLLPLAAFAAAVALLVILRRTPFGRRWRAFSDDAVAARLMGVDPSRLIVVTMALAAGAASLAGVMTTMFYGGIGFSGGQTIGLKALVAAVIGGLASVEGAMLGGVILGLMEAVWSAVFSIESRDVAIFSLLVLLLVFAPNGFKRDRISVERLSDKSRDKTKV